MVVVLSVFDGASCGMEALLRAGIDVQVYYASEIDKDCIFVSKKNHPSIIQIGDVTKVSGQSLPGINIFIGGSPCQGFSKAGKGLNFDDPRSKLFFEFVRLKKECNPEYFLYENVAMKQEWQDVISEFLGVKPIVINSRVLSAQNRKRLYWTNIPFFNNLIDKNILLSDIILNGDVDRDKSFCLDANYFKGTNAKTYFCKNRRQIVWMIPEATKKGYVEVTENQCVDLTFIKSKTRRGRLMIEKSNCLTASKFVYAKVTNDWFRLLTPIECERLQTLPDDYTAGVSKSARYKMLGNGWTVDVIAEIFKALPDKFKKNYGENSNAN